MTFTPHPIVMTTLARQRGAELQAQADRFRLATLAQDGDGDHRRQQRSDRAAIAAVALALALLAAGRGAVADAASQPQQDLARTAAQVTAPVLAEEDPDTSAVQKVREAAN
jgi:hypothetical protein